MDDIISQAYFKNRRVADLRLLLIEAYPYPEKAHLLTSNAIRYRYSKLVRSGIKRLIFLAVKLRQVSKMLADVEPVVLDDKRIKYLIWAQDAS